jgi:hypothetical protein
LRPQDTFILCVFFLLLSPVCLFFRPLAVDPPPPSLCEVPCIHGVSIVFLVCSKKERRKEEKKKKEKKKKEKRRCCGVQNSSHLLVLFYIITKMQLCVKLLLPDLVYIPCAMEGGSLLLSSREEPIQKLIVSLVGI